MCLSQATMKGLVDVIIAQNVQLSCLKYEPLTARQDRT